MRLTCLTCTLLVAASACSSSFTAPPNGLPASVSLVASSNGLQLPSIVGAGDSVVALASDPDNACASRPTVAAGLRSGTLIITLSNALPRRPCGILAAATIFAVSVHNVPGGTRMARLVLRTVNGGTTEESTLGTASIALP